jgi:membrane-associated phospholipid phosphatase
MKNKILFFLLFITIYSSALLGQQKYTFSQFGKETWEFVKQPTKWDAIDYTKLCMMSFLTYEIMVNYDQTFRTAVLKDQRYYKSFPIELGRMWGELYTPVILFSGFAIHSLITDDITTRKIAFEIGQASLYAGAVTFLLKTAIGRARPYTNEGIYSFHPFSTLFNQDDHSFPGGHNVAAFVLSTVLSRNAKPVWLKVLAYLPAVLTFVSRIYQDQHWTSDDFAGAVLGYFIATWVVDKHENNDKSIIDVSSTYPLSIRIALD